MKPRRPLQRSGSSPIVGAPRPATAARSGIKTALSEAAPPAKQATPATASWLPLGAAGGDCVRVFVRVRPPTEREQLHAGQPVVAIDRNTHSVILGGSRPGSFTFDGVQGEEATQDEIFDQVGRGVGASCLAGYNSSLYVYGQTGAGKTYTMFGPSASAPLTRADERRGLGWRLLEQVFEEILWRSKQEDGVSYVCRCSFLEIYKEQITDLLEPSSSGLQLREDTNRGVHVERLSEPVVVALAEASQLLWKGLQQRRVGATHMNERSSRSHAVFTLHVELTHTNEGVVRKSAARLSLVDLAGSERQQGLLDNPGSAPSTPCQSLRVREAGAINRSLSTLTNVIMALSQEERSRRRSSCSGAAAAPGSPGAEGPRRGVPFAHYRDSKLTYLLRDSLGGNSKTVIMANVSPSPLCVSETSSSLKFAARAKRIRCAAVQNEEFSGTVEGLVREVKCLRQQLVDLTSRRQLLSPAFSSSVLTSSPGGSSGGDRNEEGGVAAFTFKDAAWGAQQRPPPPNTPPPQGDVVAGASKVTSLKAEMEGQDVDTPPPPPPPPVARPQGPTRSASCAAGVGVRGGAPEARQAWSPSDPLPRAHEYAAPLDVRSVNEVGAASARGGRSPGTPSVVVRSASVDGRILRGKDQDLHAERTLRAALEVLPDWVLSDVLGGPTGVVEECLRVGRKRLQRKMQEASGGGAFHDDRGRAEVPGAEVTRRVQLSNGEYFYWQSGGEPQGTIAADVGPSFGQAPGSPVQTLPGPTNPATASWPLDTAPAIPMAAPTLGAWPPGPAGWGPPAAALAAVVPPWPQVKAARPPPSSPSALSVENVWAHERSRLGGAPVPPVRSNGTALRRSHSSRSCSSVGSRSSRQA